MLVEILKPHPVTNKKCIAIWDKNPLTVITDRDSKKIKQYTVIADICNNNFCMSTPHILIIVYNNCTISSNNSAEIDYLYIFEYYYKYLDDDKCIFGEIYLNENNDLVHITHNQNNNPDLWFIHNNIEFVNQPLESIETAGSVSYSIDENDLIQQNDSPTIELAPSSFSISSGIVEVTVPELEIGKVEDNSFRIDKEKQEAQERFMRNMSKKFALKNGKK